MARQKPTKSFTVDPENARFVEELDNASTTVNDLITQYRKGAEKQTVALKMQRDHKEDELKEAKETVKRLQNEIADLEHMINAFETAEEKNIQEARDALQNTDLDPTNPAIQTWADKLDMTEVELIEAL